MKRSSQVETKDTLAGTDRLNLFPKLRSKLYRILIASAAGTVLLTAGCGGDSSTSESWVGTWAAAPTGPKNLDSVPTIAPLLTLENRTVRMIVRSSVAGSFVRVRLSNEIGESAAPVQVGAAHIALRNTGSAIDPSAGRALTFNGQSTVTIPAKGFVVSDPVELKVPALTDMAVSMYLPNRTVIQSVHATTRQTNYLSTAGNFTTATQLANPTTTTFWYLLTGVDVLTTNNSSALVALGDSITDGFGEPTNRVDPPTPWPSWPSRLAERLQSSGGDLSRLAVLNAGISGNRVLNDAAPTLPVSAASELGLAIFGPSAVSRFQRDVAKQTGASCTVVLEGINDIGQGPARNQVVTAEQVIAGHQQLLSQARTAGLRVIGATLTPFAGYVAPYYSAENEAKRQAVNTWIRTSGQYDAVIDFDASVRDPAAPTRLLAAYDSGDHLHPSDAGYKAMADAIDLSMIKRLCLP